MSRDRVRLAEMWQRVGPRFLPFADAASETLPLARLLRLSLFQISVGMAVVLISGTLNRVMIVELGVEAWIVALMISLPLAVAPFRVLVGHRSDHYTSAIGWRRTPYIWIGTLLQFGGLAIMPFALLVLSGDTHGPLWIGKVAAALAFLLVGAGLHTTQTAGLALATDLAPEDTRPRVVALMYVMLLAGMLVSSLILGGLLADFSQLRLIKVIQGAAVITMVLNLCALWRQEALCPAKTRTRTERPSLRASWEELKQRTRVRRFLLVVAIGTAAFSMQEVLLEPYGGEVLGLSVAATTVLTALFALGSLAAFAGAARYLGNGGDAYRTAGVGAVVGLFAFSAVIFAGTLGSAALFRFGTVLIGFGAGLFAVGTLVAAMSMDTGQRVGLALGAWGATHAFAAGTAIAAGGAIRDIVGGWAAAGQLGPALTGVETGYSVVYHLEVFLLFITLAVLGPLVSFRRVAAPTTSNNFGLANFPG